MAKAYGIHFWPPLLPRIDILGLSVANCSRLCVLNLAMQLDTMPTRLDRTSHARVEKAKVRKRGSSLRSKTKELGELCNIFSAVVYWDPTQRKMEYAMHLPDGERLPDINAIVRHFYYRFHL
jgi:hypothetical protein